MKKYNKGFAVWALIVGVLAVGTLFAVGYNMYKNNSANNSQVNIVNQNSNLPASQSVNNASPSNSKKIFKGRSLCNYFTLTDAQAVLGSTAYVSVSEYFCEYKIPDDMLKNMFVSASFDVTEDGYNLSLADSKLLYNSLISAGGKDVSGITEWAVETSVYGANIDVMITFFHKGITGFVAVTGTSKEQAQSNRDRAIELVK